MAASGKGSFKTPGGKRIKGTTAQTGMLRGMMEEKGYGVRASFKKSGDDIIVTYKNKGVRTGKWYTSKAAVKPAGNVTQISGEYPMEG